MGDDVNAAAITRHPAPASAAQDVRFASLQDGKGSVHMAAASSVPAAGVQGGGVVAASAASGVQAVERSVHIAAALSAPAATVHWLRP